MSSPDLPSAGERLEEAIREKESGGPKSLLNIFDSDTIESGINLGLTNQVRWWLNGEIHSPYDDPNFHLNSGIISEFAKDIDPHYVPSILDARSDHHLKMLKSRAMEATKSAQVLADARWGGSIAGVGAQVLDPINVAAMAVGGLAGTAAGVADGVQLARAARILRMAKYGMIEQGATSAGVEAIRLGVDPLADKGMSVANIASDMLVGGVGSGLSDQARIVRAIAGGNAATIPQAAYLAIDEDAQTEEASSIFLWSMLVGGGFSAIAPRSPLDNRLIEAASEFDMKINGKYAITMDIPMSKRGKSMMSQYMPDQAIERANETVAKIAGLEGPPRHVAVSEVAAAGSPAPRSAATRDMTLNEFREAFARGEITLGKETRTESTSVTGKKSLTIESESIGPSTAYDRLKASGELPQVPVSVRSAATGVPAAGREKLPTKWYRGVREGQDTTDGTFYSASRDSADAFGKVGKAERITPKNPLIYDSKQDAADALGLGVDDVMGVSPSRHAEIDRAIAADARAKGHDAVVYHNGSFDAPEMHVLPSPAATGGVKQGIHDPQIYYVKSDPFTKTEIGATNKPAAAAQQPKPVNLEYEVFPLVNIHDGTTRFVGMVKGVPTLQYDMGNLVGQSSISEFRALQNILGGPPVSRLDAKTGDPTVAPFTLLEGVNARVGNVYHKTYMTAISGAYKDWIAENTKQGMRNIPARLWGEYSRGKFGQQVFDAMETLTDGGTVSSPAIMKAATETSKMFADNWAFMHYHGVDGVNDPTMPNQWYVPHRARRHALDNLVAKHIGNLGELYDAIGTQVIRPRLKARGQQTAQDLDKLARVFAKAWVDRGGSTGENSFIHGMSPSQADELINDLSITDAGEQALVRSYVKAEGGTPTYLHNRIDFNAHQTFQTSQGSFKMGDMLERNVFSLGYSYTRRTVGQAAVSAAQPVFQKMYGTTKPITSLGDFLSTVEGIASSRKLHDAEQANIKRLETMYRAVSGLPLWTPDSKFKDGAAGIVRSALNMNYFARMSGVRATLNPIQDWATAASGPDGSMGAAKRFFPDVFHIIGEMRKGTRPGPGLTRTATEMGLGIDRNHDLVALRNLEDSYFPKIQRAEDVSGALARSVSKYVGVDAGQRFSELSTWNREAQAFYDSAKAGRPLGPERARQDGLSPTQARVMQEQIAKHAVIIGGELMDENFGKWTVPEAAVLYRLMLARRVRRALNMGDQALQSRWMVSPWGRMAMQFQRYPVMAHTNQIAASIDRGTAYSLHKVISGGAVAAVNYAVGVYLDSIGRPDAQEYRDRMLSDEMIWKAAFARQTMSGLTPRVVDTAFALADERPPFAPQRISGVSSDNGVMSMWTQNPTIDWMASALGAASSLRAPFDEDYDFSQRNGEAIRKAMWVPQAYGISNGFRHLYKNAPKRSKRDQ